MEDFFDFSDKEFTEVYVEESFVAEVQHEIVRLMKNKGISRAELARRMKVSAPHVSQMLGDEDANLTLRTVARIFDALDEKATIAARSVTISLEAQSILRPVVTTGWGCAVSNDRWSHDNELGKTQDGQNAAVWIEAMRRAA